MKNNAKKISNVLLIVGIVFILLALYSMYTHHNKKDDKLSEKEEYIEVNEDGSKINISEKLKENKKFENLEIKNIKLSYSNGYSTIEFNAINNSTTDFEQKDVIISILDKKGNTLETILGTIFLISSGDSAKLNFSIDADVVNAYDLKFEEYNM